MSTSDTFSFISSRGPLGPADYRRAAERLGGVIDRLPYHDSTNFLLRDIAGLLDHAADALPQPAHPWDDKTTDELFAIAVDCDWTPVVGRSLDRLCNPEWIASIYSKNPRRGATGSGPTPNGALLDGMKKLEQEIRKP